MKPLIGIGEILQHKNIINLLCVLAVFPITELFKNELFAYIMTIPTINSNNIDGLLGSRNLVVYTDRIKNSLWKDGSFLQLIDNKILLQKFHQLVNNKLNTLDLFSDEWKSLIEKPRELVEKIKKSVLLEDEDSIVFFKTFLQRFISVQSGEESYLPKLITPLSYGNEL